MIMAVITATTAAQLFIAQIEAAPPVTWTLAAKQQLAYAVALEYGIPPGAFCAVVQGESDYDENAVSSSKCLGLTQISPRAWSVDMARIFEPLYNLRYGAKIFKLMLSMYEGDVLKAAIAYNIGHGALNKLLASPSWRARVPRATWRYAVRIENEVWQPSEQAAAWIANLEREEVDLAR